MNRKTFTTIPRNTRKNLGPFLSIGEGVSPSSKIIHKGPVYPLSYSQNIQGPHCIIPPVEIEVIDQNLSFLDLLALF